jgi:hypothetical protein
MHRRRTCAVWLLLTAAGAGCGEARPQPVTEAAPQRVPAASQFDATTAGTVHGRVLWNGPIPVVPPFEICSLVLEPSLGKPRLWRDNPHAPRIDAATGGVAGAVVFLRGIDSLKARPWDLASVSGEHQDRQLHIIQGTLKSRVGFVRQGDAITMVSREPVLNNLHAKGAAYFALMLPDIDQPLTRVLANKGIVELTSGAGWYWMHGTLFVDDHPYYVRTNGQGNFEMPQVPPGRYEVVCWMPNWNEAGHDRDPETCLVIRLRFQPPVLTVQEIVVEPSGDVRVEFAMTAAMFPR